MAFSSSIDLSQQSIREQIAKTRGKSIESDVIGYREAVLNVKHQLTEDGTNYTGQNLGTDESQEVLKNKEYAKEKIKYMREKIKTIVVNANWRVIGYDESSIGSLIETNQQQKPSPSDYFYENQYSTDDKDLQNEEDEVIERLKQNPNRVMPWNELVRKKKNIDDLVNELTADIAGFKALTPLFDDPKVSDIFILTWNMIYVERAGVNRLYKGTFRSQKDYLDFIEHYLGEVKKTIDRGANKIVDFEVFGNRGCGVDKSITPRDTSLTIRVHPESHITLKQIIDWGCMNDEKAEFFRLILKGECNLIYAGLTGSGKTTTIRALLDAYIPQLKRRAMVCEDTQELFLENPHTLEFVSFKHEKPELAVPLQQVIYTALRQKPKYIIVGEVRGEEAQAAVEGMETGHSTIFTMHGGKAINCINRLVTKYLTSMPSLGIEVVERIIGEAVDYIAIQDNIPDIGRKITSISEISYDYEKRTIQIKPIFKFDFEIEDFVRVSGLHEDKISKMLARGVTYKELKNGPFYNWTDDSNYQQENHPYDNHIIGEIA